MKVKCISSFYVLKKGVFNIGDIVEFENELTRRLITQGVVIEYVDEKHSIEETINYNELTVKELKEILKERGLSTTGKKTELIERLKDCDNNA